MFFTFRLNLKRTVAVLSLVAVLLLLPYFINATKRTAATATPKKVACLTFDDGPSAYTEQVLAVLDKYGVKATFFVTGQNEEYFPFIGEAHRAGHQIALHTYSHEFSKIYASRESFWTDINKLQELIVNQTGKSSNALRFAGGSSNTICRRYGGDIMKSLIADCDERGISYYDWNVDTKDAVNGTISASSIAKRAVDGARQQPVAVILMHDGTLGRNAAEALEIIIPELIDEGYSFSRLDEIGAAVHHNID